MMKWKIVALLASLLVLPALAADYKTIDWDVLIPEGEKLCRHPRSITKIPCRYRNRWAG